MYRPEYYMQRCLIQAKKGLGNVAPNPLVGCVIVRDGRIIAEGYHRQFGGPHAEVNAIERVDNPDILKEATLYVNLEPCSHHGKTPPCADLIVKSGVKNVVVGALDPNPKVAGNGIKRLKEAGIKVELNCLESECKTLNKRFYHFHSQKKPFVILKWAQSTDGFLDWTRTEGEKGVQWITGPNTQLINHKWRSEEQAILIGANTFNTDLPELTNRLWPGKNPVRMVVCSSVKSLNTKHLKHWAKDNNAVVFCKEDASRPIPGLEIISIKSKNLKEALSEYCLAKEIQSVIIEGGEKTLRYFIEENFWNEMRVFIGSGKPIVHGIKAPEILGKNISNQLLENGDRLLISEPH
ncbi:MAG: bifunctional diaminohydroxyphosphoribosylaminopyrimidine deaminase/5-amino-6-(5-phosphoribosylamino)uracil reductase RibD [Luteibaculum sp.]